MPNPQLVMMCNKYESEFRELLKIMHVNDLLGSQTENYLQDGMKSVEIDAIIFLLIEKGVITLDEMTQARIRVLVERNQEYKKTIKDRLGLVIPD